MMDQSRTRHVKAILLELILNEINSHEHVHGYGLIKTIRLKTGVYTGPSTIYPLLCHMEHIGLVAGVWVTTGAKPVKEYSLTTKGRFELSNSTRDLKFLVQALIVV